MNFDFTEDQHEIKRTARELLAKRSGVEQIREAAESEAYDESLFTELRELGWTGIAIDEQYGGAGLGVVELRITSYNVCYTKLLRICSATPTCDCNNNFQGFLPRCRRLV